VGQEAEAEALEGARMTPLMLALSLFAQTPTTVPTTPPPAPVRMLEVTAFLRATKAEALTISIPMEGPLTDDVIWRVSNLVKKMLADLQ
jgi:hypothetical protein